MTSRRVRLKPSLRLTASLGGEEGNTIHRRFGANSLIFNPRPGWRGGGLDYKYLAGKHSKSVSNEVRRAQVNEKSNVNGSKKALKEF